MSEDEAVGHTSIKVDISGEQYTLRTDADEEHARRCAALVDARMRRISGDSGPVSKKVAIMAAISLADDIVKQQSDIGARSRALAERIEAAIED